jgi:hypothetical protein
MFSRIGKLADTRFPQPVVVALNTDDAKLPPDLAAANAAI